MALKVTLTILDSAITGKKAFELTRPQKYFIGRDSGCDVPVSGNETVSSRHCSIEVMAAKVVIEDLQSTNGTYVSINGQEMLVGRKGAAAAAPREVPSGAVIRVGEVQIQVTIATVANQPGKPTALMGIRAGVVRAIDGIKGNLVDLSENQVIEQVVPWIKIFNGNPDLPAAIRGHRIISALGKGSYGEVYLATDGTGQQVALKKMLDASMSNKTNRERFKREIKNLEFLDHPNIAKLIDSDIYDNSFFYTMEYCGLGSLEGLIQFMGGTLPLDIAKPIIAQVLDGLIYLHRDVAVKVRTPEGYKTANTLVHRDLKPSNILLVNNGINLVAKISDFGLSKALGVEASVITQQSSKPLGSYEFVCRRQLQYFREAEPELDVWAAVACLYYMLTGTTPRDFSGHILAETAVEKENAVPIRDRNPHIPQKLADMIDSALAEDAAKDNQMKFRSAVELKEALMKAFP